MFITTMYLSIKLITKVEIFYYSFDKLWFVELFWFFLLIYAPIFFWFIPSFFTGSNIFNWRRNFPDSQKETEVANDHSLQTIMYFIDVLTGLKDNQINITSTGCSIWACHFLIVSTMLGIHRIGLLSLWCYFSGA